MPTALKSVGFLGARAGALWWQSSGEEEGSFKETTGDDVSDKMDE